MTLLEIQKLSDMQLTRLVAKLDGYKLKSRRVRDRWATRHEVDTAGRSIIVLTEIPYYHKDLNAMADAVAGHVRRNGTAAMVTFNDCLAQVIGHHDHMEIEMVHATARQRAEAFVLAVQRGYR